MSDCQSDDSCKMKDETMRCCKSNECCEMVYNQDMFCVQCAFDKFHSTEYDFISQYVCILTLEKCEKEEEKQNACWRNAISAFYYHQFTVSFPDKKCCQMTPRDKFFKIKYIDAMFTNFERVTEIYNESVMKKLIKLKKPAFIIYEKHYFVFIGCSKRKDVYILQSFCPQQNCFILLSKENMNLVEIHYLNLKKISYDKLVKL